MHTIPFGSYTRVCICSFVHIPRGSLTQSIPPSHINTHTHTHIDLIYVPILTCVCIFLRYFMYHIRIASVWNTTSYRNIETIDGLDKKLFLVIVFSFQYYFLFSRRIIIFVHKQAETARQFHHPHIFINTYIYMMYIWIYCFFSHMLHLSIICMSLYGIVMPMRK